jgi:hypothetical protein
MGKKTNPKQSFNHLDVLKKQREALREAVPSIMGGKNG